MNIRMIVFGFALILTGLGPLPAASEWEEVKMGPRSYVTLESFARFYKLKLPTVPTDDFYELRGEGVVVVFRSNSRESFLNGKKVWLSFSTAVDESGRMLVPKADVILLFDPMIRRGRAVPPRPFKGVLIDPGHGGADRGARSAAGYTEKAATLDTSLRLEKVLKAEGIPTAMTRRTDVFITLEERAATAAKYPGYVFVSVHYNAGPRHSHGVETYALSPQGTPSTSSGGVFRSSDYESQPGNRTNLHNILLTGMIHREITKMHSPAGDRGVKRARFVVLRENQVPSVLVEGGFMSNATDASLIASGAYRQKMAEAMANGLKAYVREVDPTHPWLRTQAGQIEPPPLLKPAQPVPAIPLRKPEEIVPKPTEPVPTPTPTPEPSPAPAAAPVPPPAALVVPDDTNEPGPAPIPEPRETPSPDPTEPTIETSPPAGSESGGASPSEPVRAEPVNAEEAP
jgi:N-acetylmuramoyl-L-alanine amidase